MNERQQFQAKVKLARRWEQGRMSTRRFEDEMFELERAATGLAECPTCGKETMHFHEHICGWKCTSCGDVQPTGRVKRIISR